jgi:hypothetical protein
VFFCFCDAALAATLILGDDSHAASMERRRVEQVAPNRPVANVAEPGKVPIRRRN